ncbi:MAG: hypothetical protein J6R04_07885 [Clostridia bacterium]|nr:hypothetical protein [Clostridia bacterium]
MVLDTNNTTLAYRCPKCGAAVFSGLNVFSLTADMLKLKCSCGESELVLVNSGDGRVRLTVPCMLCPAPHQFTLNKSLLFGKELFCMPCPYTDIDLCCVGEENHVKAEMSRAELELLDLLEQNGFSDFRELSEASGRPEDERFPTDPQVLDIVMFVIRDLDEEGKIKCHCTSRDEGHTYDVDIRDDGVLVSCSACGASRLIPTDSGLSAHAFLNSDSLDLTVEQD